jgi:N-acetylglucosaminyldiphosphoundecaprenol N-acetyl-beta-D-mannosaminyltransferase
MRLEAVPHLLSLGSALFSVAGIGVHVVDLDDAVGQVIHRLQGGESFTVFTLNLDHIAKLRQDDAFKQAYARASIVTADGFPVAWAGRIQGVPVQRTTGADLMIPLCEAAARLRLPVALVGSTAEALGAAAGTLARRIPHLDVRACISPSFGFDPTGPESDRIIDVVAASGAKLCFVGLGAPKQEYFATRAAERSNGIGWLCTGAAADFLAGTQRRAPAVLQMAGAEWLWRLLNAPSRLLPRYMSAAAVLPLIVGEAVAKARRIGPQG